MRILVQDGEVMMGDLTFEQDRITVGTDSKNNIILPGKAVSEQHVILEQNDEGKWFVEPAHPNLTITVNNIPLLKRVPVQEGMTIAVDRYRLKAFMHWKSRHDEAAEELTAEQVALIRRSPLPPGTIVKGHADEISIATGWLDRISVISSEISHCADVPTLIDYTLGMMLRVFGAGMAYVGTRKTAAGHFESVEGRSAKGTAIDLPRLGTQMVFRSVEKSVHLLVVKADDGPIASAMSVPLLTAAGNLGVVYVDSRTEGQHYKPWHLDLLSVIASRISQVLAELLQGGPRRPAPAAAPGPDDGPHWVQTVQHRLDAEAPPTWSGLQLAARTRPGRRSTDLYDITRQPNGNVAVFLAAAHGEDADAALTLTEARAGFRTALMHGDAPHIIIRALNLLMTDCGLGGRFDGLCLFLDPASGELKWCAGGDLHALVVDSLGTSRTLTLESAPTLGSEKTRTFATQTASLADGEMLVLYSPGLTSAISGAGEPLTEAALVQDLSDCVGQDVGQTLDEIMMDFDETLRDGSQPADITLVLLLRGD